ncbi:MAG: hypothetical protein V4579_00470 [Pseudomonadota bacterium]
MSSRPISTVPLSRHPLFPALVALWFAALLGLGSLAVRAVALERLVLALRLDLVVAAAAPPLGLPARLVVALALACGGGLVGFVLARRVGGQSYARGLESRNHSRGRTAGLSPTAIDDGEDFARLDAARTDQPGRRRAVRANADLRPPAGTPTMAELAPRILNFSDLDPLPPLEDDAAQDIAVHAPSARLRATFVPQASDFADPVFPAEAGNASVPEVSSLAPLPHAATIPVDATAAGVLREASLAALGMVELVERFALALSTRRTPAAPPETGQRPFDTPLSQGGAARFRPARFDDPTACADVAEHRQDRSTGRSGSLLDMKPPARKTAAVAGMGTDPDEPHAPGEAAVPPVVILPACGSAGHSVIPAIAVPPGAGAAATDQALHEALAVLQRISGTA